MTNFFAKNLNSSITTSFLVPNMDVKHDPSH